MSSLPEPLRVNPPPTLTPPPAPTLTPTGRYCAVPLKSFGTHQPCRYYQEVRWEQKDTEDTEDAKEIKETHWRPIEGSPRKLYAGDAVHEVTIMSANKSFVNHHCKQEGLDSGDLDSSVVLLCAVVQALDAGVGSPGICWPAISGTTMETVRQLHIPVAAKRQGALIIFGIVENGNVVKIMCTDDPEIQNGVG